MNLQSVVMVILRLGAISGLLQGTVYLWMTTSLRAIGDRNDFSGQVTSLAVIGFGVLAVTALVWILALPIARQVTHGSERQLTIGTLTAEQFYRGIFVGVGAYYAVAYLASVLDWTFTLFRSAAARSGSDWMYGINGHDLFTVYATFVFGVILIAKSGKLAAWVSKRDPQPAPIDPAKSGDCN